MALSTVPYALVVDDDPLILMHACDILEEAGFRFFDANDGDAAKDLLDAHADSVTLLFTDVEMPGSINGYQLAHHVSRRWPEIAIVVASGRMTPAPGDMPEGATFISKPFSTELVHNHLRELLPDGRKPEPLRQAV